MKLNTKKKSQINIHDDTDMDAAIREQAAKISALLPPLVDLSAALGELYELFVDGEIEGDFDDYCYREFNLNPDLVREAADRIRAPRLHELAEVQS